MSLPTIEIFPPGAGTVSTQQAFTWNGAGDQDWHLVTSSSESYVLFLNPTSTYQIQAYRLTAHAASGYTFRRLEITYDTDEEGSQAQGGNTYVSGYLDTVKAEKERVGHPGTFFTRLIGDYSETSGSYSYSYHVTGIKAVFDQGTPPATTYTISAYSSPQNGGTVQVGNAESGATSSQSVEVGGSVNIVATAASGYAFKGWYLGNTLVSSSATYTVSNVMAAPTFEARFVPVYTVTVVTLGFNGRVSLNGTMSPSQDAGFTLVSDIFERGTSVTIAAYSRNSSVWPFKAWYRDPYAWGDPETTGTFVSSSSSYTFNVTADATYFATFADAPTLFVAATADGITPNVTPTINGQAVSVLKVADGRQVTLSAPVDGGAIESVAYGDAHLVFKQWQKLVPESGSEYQVLSTSPTYTFTASLANDNEQFEAYYEVCYELTVGIAPNSSAGTVSVSPQSRLSGYYPRYETLTLTATPSSGYAFAFWAWTERGTTRKSYDSTYSYTVDDDFEITAHFKSSNECQIRVESDGKCTVSGDGIYTIGASCTVAATFNSNVYDFDHWEKDGASVSTSASYTFIVAGDATFTAYVKYREFTVAVSADPSEGGTATGGGAYQYGERARLQASPSTGYGFDGWYKNDRRVSTSTSYSFIVSEDCAYVARFSKQTFTISVSVSGGGGSVTGGGVYEYGDTCTLTATAENLYTFVRWNDDDTSATKTFTVTQNESFTAYFARGLRITTVASPEGGGTTTGDGIYEYSDRVQLKATPSKGYELDHWEKDGDVVGYSVRLYFTFKWSDAGTYTAVFSLVSEGELIYDDATGRLICADSGQLIYHDKMTPSH